jgi:hypothetical protein
MGLLNVKASVPIFTGGLLRGRIAAGQAELEGALAAQDRTVLSSLEEVETAYGLRAGFDARVAGLVSARTLSARRADELQAFYRAGRVTLGDVLQARLDTLSDADKLEQARIAQRSATVQLYRALGGGWSPPAPGHPFHPPILPASLARSSPDDRACCLPSPAAPPPAPDPLDGLAATLDRAAFAGIASMTGGLSPVTVAQAFSDWALHLAASPGKRLDLVARRCGNGCAWPTSVAMAPIPNIPEPRRSSPCHRITVSMIRPAARPFGLITQSFLLAQQWWNNATTGISGSAPITRRSLPLRSARCSTWPRPAIFWRPIRSCNSVSSIPAGCVWSKGQSCSSPILPS